jgi:type II secretory pathway pseudopilin PulG
MHIPHQQKNTWQTRGFTIIETLVAVTIFTVAILGMMAVLSNNLKDINYAKRQVIATYLAQEGIEYFRNMRDTYVLYESAGSGGWTDFLVKISPCEKSQGSPGCYFIDEMNYDDNDAPITKDTFKLVTCPGDVCEELRYNKATGAYNYTAPERTPFTRKINTIRVNDHEVQVYATVSWVSAGKQSQVVLSENLLNWQEGS